jgi:hypothetical protein
LYVVGLAAVTVVAVLLAAETSGHSVD